MFCSEPDSEVVPDHSTQCTELLRALATRRYLRHPLVRSPELTAMIDEVVASEAPVRVVFVWGKGRKRVPDLAEHQAAEFLMRYAERVKRDWLPGLEYTVLFADTHAQLNGYGRHESERYFSAVRKLLEPGIHHFGRLSDLWHEGQISWPVLERFVLAARGGEVDQIVSELKLVEAAARHALSHDSEWSARLYCVTRREENRILTSRFAGHLYATSDQMNRQPLLPRMPILHMYSRPCRFCIKPWHAIIPMEGAVENQLCAA